MPQLSRGVRQNKMRRLAFLAALIVVASTSASLARHSLDELAARDNLDPLPPWSYAEMARAALDGLPGRSSADVRDFRLLAWHGVVDDRPVHVEQALFWVSLRLRARGEQWALVQLGRNPDRPDVFSKWALYVVMDTPWQPVRLFDHSPTNAEVYGFLDFWKFSPDPSWRLLTSGVRERTWKHATGEPPTEFYPTNLSNNRLKLPARGRSEA